MLFVTARADTAIESTHTHENEKRKKENRFKNRGPNHAKTITTIYENDNNNRVLQKPASSETPITIHSATNPISDNTNCDNTIDVCISVALFFLGDGGW